VLSSVPTGFLTPGGHPEFDTQRTELGELVYRLKYGNAKGNSGVIAEAMVGFVREAWGDVFDVVVPMPPSITRSVQPAWLIAEAVSERLGVPWRPEAVQKVRATGQMKNVPVLQRDQLLRNAIQTGPAPVAGERVLLVDDVVESGATLRRVAQVLLEAGAVSVHALVATRTR
jgi:predicted amidophosphoribosyltransferase